jgi:GntR family transcriptional regulator
LVTLDYRDARPIYSQIYDGLREQILAGILQPGDKLPSVRELASTLAINPNTIQRAYQQLEADGWICSQAGKGSFVGDVPIPLSAEQHHLWAELDKLLAAAAHLDISREEIIRHIREGGNEHA